MPHENAEGRRDTENDEGLVLYAYDDLDGHYPHPPIMPGDHVRGTLTIGYGHTGPDVHPGMKITAAQADTLLAADMHGFEVAVNNMVSRNLTSNQFSALVDFAYNEGAGALHGSTLLRLVNEGDFAGAAEQFAVWNKAGGRVQPGLVARRAQERALFLKPDGT